MNQIFHHYLKWEDWQQGMYAVPDPDEVRQEAETELAEALLDDPTGLYLAMSHVANNWTYAAEQNLTNLSTNRRAWLGQAACSWQHGIPAVLTKRAWWRLTDNARHRANTIADQVLVEWKAKRCPEQSSQMSMFSQQPNIE